MKKIMCILLIAFLMITTPSASAIAGENASEANQEQTSTITGTDISVVTKRKIEETGIHISEKTKIELVPISSSQGESTRRALVVTNESCNIITKDVLLLVDDETVGFDTGTAANTRGESSAEFPPLSWDGRYVIRGTAVYNQYNDGWFSSFYQPIKVYFSYQKYDTCTVNNITLSYICDGFECSYPGFEDLGLNELRYVITVTKASPSVNTTYSTSRPYNTNRVIFTGSGSPFVGQCLTFEATVNGESNGYTVSL